MKEEAFALCKAKYEEVYGIPLTYGDEETETEESDEGTETAENNAGVEV